MYYCIREKNLKWCDMKMYSKTLYQAGIIWATSDFNSSPSTLVIQELSKRNVSSFIIGRIPDPIFHTILSEGTVQIPHSSNLDGSNKNPCTCQVLSRAFSSKRGELLQYTSMATEQ